MKLKQYQRSKKYDQQKTKRVPVVEILEDSQLRLIQEISNLRDRSICILLLNTGMRVDELHNLNYEDVFESVIERAPTSSITIIGKGNKERNIPLNNVCQQAVRDIDTYNQTTLKIEGIEPYFPLLISRQANRLTVRRIQQIIKKTVGSHPHVFRHTCLTQLRRSGVKLEVIQALAGHSQINTTAKYYLAVNNDDLKEAIECLEK